MRILGITFFVLNIVAAYTCAAYINAEDTDRDRDAVLHEERLGKIFYEAQQYERALIIYDHLLTGDLRPWVVRNGQEATIYYDKGAILLAQGKDEEALAFFKAIKSGPDPSPLLWRHLQLNIARAMLINAQKYALKIPEEAVAFEEKQQRAILQIQKAQEFLKESEKADCSLMKLAGSPSCSQPADVHELNVMLSQTIDTLQERLEHFRISHPLPRVGDQSHDSSHNSSDNSSQNISKTSPEGVLTDLINAQKQAYSLQGTREFLPANEGEGKEMQAKILAVQSQTLNKSLLLRDGILVEQEKEYKAIGSLKSEGSPSSLDEDAKCENAQAAPEVYQSSG